MQRLFIDRVPRDALYERCAPARNWTAGLGCVTKEVEGPGYLSKAMWRGRDSRAGETPGGRHLDLDLEYVDEEEGCVKIV